MRSISKLSKGNVFAVIFSASFAAFHKYFGKVHSGKAPDYRRFILTVSERNRETR